MQLNPSSTGNEDIGYQSPLTIERLRPKHLPMAMRVLAIAESHAAEGGHRGDDGWHRYEQHVAHERFALDADSFGRPSIAAYRSVLPTSAEVLRTRFGSSRIRLSDALVLR